MTPWDTGLRFRADRNEARAIRDPYALVQWSDRLGTRWEHKLGVVRQIREDEPWEP